jgi:hypothetical protein
MKLLTTDGRIALAVIGGELAFIVGCVALDLDPGQVAFNLIAFALLAYLGIGMLGMIFAVLGALIHSR